MITVGTGGGAGVAATGVTVGDAFGVDVGLAVGEGEAVGDGCCAIASGPGDSGSTRSATTKAAVAVIAVTL
jgi:hypothetical protein